MRRITLVTAGLALIIILQSHVDGQIQPPRRTPVPKSSTTRVVFPDLKVTDIKYDEPNCTVHVRVANAGLGDAGKFYVWMNFVDAPIKGFTESSGMKHGNDGWVAYSAWNQAWQSEAMPKCLIKNMTRIQAVVDARFLYGKVNNFHTLKPTTGGLIKPESPVPYGMSVAEPQIQESNENNNQLVVSRADVKSWP